MRNLKNKKLALFFTRSISLKIWEEAGILSREIEPYKKLADFFKEVYFFTYGDGEDLKYQKILPKNIKIFPKKWNLPATFYSLFLPFFFRKELKEVDILKTNQMDGSWAAVLTKFLYNKKLIVRCGYEWLQFSEKQVKSLWKKKIIYLIEKVVYSTADKIILSSKASKNFVESRFRIDSSKIKIIPNYIDTELFSPLAVKKEKGRVVFVGRLTAEKNLFNLAQAIKNLPLNFVIVGDGPLKEKLKEFLKNNRVKTEFKGRIPNSQLPKELNKSEIFILPSFSEGCPKALLEAMSCGLPVIGTNVEGIREIIVHKKNGYLCEPNVVSIRKGIKVVLENKAFQRKIAQNEEIKLYKNL